MRNKKVYLSIACGLVLLWIVFLVLRSDVPDEPIVIYKATTPLSKQTDLRDTPPSKTTPDVKAAHTPTPETSEISETSEINISPVDFSQPFWGDDLPTETKTVSDKPNADVPVSPFGFGPYPEIPTGFPSNIKPIWTVSDETYSLSQETYGSEGMRNLELLARVLIKLWNDGNTGFVGGSINADGYVYPSYRDTAYVEYNSFIKPNGDLQWYISNITGLGGKVDITTKMLLSGEIPGVTLIEKRDGGINAYNYLSLNP